jgi:hypothetical protein
MTPFSQDVKDSKNTVEGVNILPALKGSIPFRL